MSSKKSYNRNNFIAAILLLAAANILIGTVLTLKSRSAMKTQIDLRMLDIANTAAYMLNGDELETLTASDSNSEEYLAGLDILRNFQNNIDLAYIYVINCEPDGSFTFSIDPSDDPGEFGEPVVSPPALVAASKGDASVDEDAYEDDWGKFYSAYSPVFDSAGEVACVVAVDFDAEWIDSQTSEQAKVAALITLLSILIAVLFSLRMYNRYKKNVIMLNNDIEELENEFNEIDRMVKNSAVKKLYLMPDSKQKELITALASGETYGSEDSGDELAVFNKDLRTLTSNMKQYIEYIHAQNYIDQLTGVGNRLSYKEAINKVSELIKSKGNLAQFTVVFLDVNGLELINTKYGFESGDEILFAAATVIRNAYGHRKVFRVASDEFIVILEDKSIADAEKYGESMDAAIKAFNSERAADAPKLGLSRGTAEFDPVSDKSYRDVFLRAEERHETQKKAFYEKLNK